MRYLLLLFSCLLLAACAGGPELATTLSRRLDSTLQQRVARQLQARRLKMKGPVTIQVGTGNVNAPKAQAPVATGASQAQDYTRAGQHGGALATASGASAGATTRTGVPPWVLVAAGLVLVLLLLLGLAYRYRRRLAALF